LIVAGPPAPLVKALVAIDSVPPAGVASAPVVAEKVIAPVPIEVVMSALGALEVTVQALAPVLVKVRRSTWLAPSESTTDVSTL